MLVNCEFLQESTNIEALVQTMDQGRTAPIEVKVCLVGVCIALYFLNQMNELGPDEEVNKSTHVFLRLSFNKNMTISA